MKQMLSERTAAVLVALSARESGLRLAEIANLTGAPLSTVQTTIKGLLDEGLAVAVGASRPKYRLAPDAPAEALRQIAEWRLQPSRSAAIHQQAAASDVPGPRLGPARRLRPAPLGLLAPALRLSAYTAVASKASVNAFQPRACILAPEQAVLWKRLAEVPTHFVLYPASR